MFAYPIRKPGWKIAARLGFPLLLRVNVTYDADANVLVAKSNDFMPAAVFACEAERAEELFIEIKVLARNIIKTLCVLESGSCQELQIVTKAHLSWPEMIKILKAHGF